MSNEQPEIPTTSGVLVSCNKTCLGKKEVGQHGPNLLFKAVQCMRVIKQWSFHSAMSEDFKASDIGIWAQKMLLNKAATKDIAKIFVNKTLGNLLDNLHNLIKAYSRSESKADEVVNSIIMIGVKLGILYSKEEFSEDEAKSLERFLRKFRTVAKIIVKFHDYSTFDQNYFLQHLNECHAHLKRSVENHRLDQTDDTVARIDMIFEFFSNPQFLDAMFDSNSEHRELVGHIANDMRRVLEETR